MEISLDIDAVSMPQPTSGPQFSGHLRTHMAFRQLPRSGTLTTIPWLASVTSLLSEAGQNLGLNSTRERQPFAASGSMSTTSQASETIMF